MQLTAFSFGVFCLISNAHCYGFYQFPNERGVFDGKHEFSECKDTECKSGKYRGFGCQDSKCEYVTSKPTSQKQDFIPKGATTMKNAFAKKTTATGVINHFPECYSAQCRWKSVYGFGCEENVCEYICKDENCFYDARLKRTRHHGHNFPDKKLVFTKCTEAHCTYGGIHGFSCLNGICNFVCRADYCNYNRKSLSHHVSEDISTSGKANEEHMNAHVAKNGLLVKFIGCESSKCDYEDWHGFKCTSGLCNAICKDKKCWKNVV